MDLRWMGKHFPEIKIAAVDLHDGLDISRASMEDYVSRVIAEAEQVPRPLALCGWSMGGLVALMAAHGVACSHLVLVEASPPGEVQGFDSSINPRNESFDSEAVYGPFPKGIPSRPESQYARDERKRGVSVASVAIPTLVISGKDHPADRGIDIARFYSAELAEFPHLNHWELIDSDSVKYAIREFLGLPKR